METEEQKESNAEYSDIQKRLEGLQLDDKWYDDFRIYKRLNQTEPPSRYEILKRAINV